MSAAQDDARRRATAAASGARPSQRSSLGSGPSVFPSAVVQYNSQADELPRMRMQMRLTESQGYKRWSARLQKGGDC